MRRRWRDYRGDLAASEFAIVKHGRATWTSGFRWRNNGAVSMDEAPESTANMAHPNAGGQCSYTISALERHG